MAFALTFFRAQQSIAADDRLFVDATLAVTILP